MPTGPGKYDGEATAIRMATHARGVALIVFDGDRGSGFSVQCPPQLTQELPAMLRTMADDMELDIIGIFGPKEPT